jgi:hypothetical protein
MDSKVTVSSSSLSSSSALPHSTWLNSKISSISDANPPRKPSPDRPSQRLLVNGQTDEDENRQVAEMVGREVEIV